MRLLIWARRMGAILLVTYHLHLVGVWIVFLKIKILIAALAIALLLGG